MAKGRTPKPRMVRLTLTPDQRIAVRAGCEIALEHLKVEGIKARTPLMKAYVEILKQIHEQEKAERARKRRAKTRQVTTKRSRA